MLMDELPIITGVLSAVILKSEGGPHRTRSESSNGTLLQRVNSDHVENLGLNRISHLSAPQWLGDCLLTLLGTLPGSLEPSEVLELSGTSRAGFRAEGPSLWLSGQHCLYEPGSTSACRQRAREQLGRCGDLLGMSLPFPGNKSTHPGSTFLTPMAMDM